MREEDVRTLLRAPPHPMQASTARVRAHGASGRSLEAPGSGLGTEVTRTLVDISRIVIRLIRDVSLQLDVQARFGVPAGDPLGGAGGLRRSGKFSPPTAQAGSSTYASATTRTSEAARQPQAG